MRKTKVLITLFVFTLTCLESTQSGFSFQPGCMGATKNSRGCTSCFNSKPDNYGTCVALDTKKDDVNCFIYARISANITQKCTRCQSGYSLNLITSACTKVEKPIAGCSVYSNLFSTVTCELCKDLTPTANGAVCKNQADQKNYPNCSLFGQKEGKPECFYCNSGFSYNLYATTKQCKANTTQYCTYTDDDLQKNCIDCDYENGYYMYDYGKCKKDPRQSNIVESQSSIIE